MKKITTNAITEKEHRILPYRGFTMMELMVVVAIIGILATITMPSFYMSRQRSEVAEALRKTETTREDITAYYNHNLAFPSDNKAAGLPEPELLIGNRFTRMQIEDGAIHVELGNKIAKPLHGKTVTFRPAVVTGSPTSPISWLCGLDEPVEGMEAVGENKTDLDRSLLPASCY
ncbi:MAG: type II secretion system GspH family protein [Gammaproteobacteria bacterium]|nr:type II secretion system GspH family protein [Gammaproteobacteria bacterium]NNJ50356.1 type II secretion system protein [Gammaproteobacteria bacterium]